MQLLYVTVLSGPWIGQGGSASHSFEFWSSAQCWTLFACFLGGCFLWFGACWGAGWLGSPRSRRHGTDGDPAEPDCVSLSAPSSQQSLLTWFCGAPIPWICPLQAFWWWHAYSPSRFTGPRIRFWPFTYILLLPRQLAWRSLCWCKDLGKWTEPPTADDSFGCMVSPEEGYPALPLLMWLPDYQGCEVCYQLQPGALLHLACPRGCVCRFPTLWSFPCVVRNSYLNGGSYLRWVSAAPDFFSVETYSTLWMPPWLGLPPLEAVGSW